MGGKDQAKTGSKASVRSGASSKNLVGKGDVGETDEHKGLNMQLTDEYEDDDFTIYFDKQSLLNRLNQLEDDNLFKIWLLQDDEAAVKNYSEETAIKIQKVEDGIENVEKSIIQLNELRDQLLQRFTYLSGSVKLENLDA